MSSISTVGKLCYSMLSCDRNCLNFSQPLRFLIWIDTISLQIAVNLNTKFIILIYIPTIYYLKVCELENSTTKVHSVNFLQLYFIFYISVIYAYITKTSHYNKQLTNSKIIIYKPLKTVNERMQIFHLRALKKRVGF